MSKIVKKKIFFDIWIQLDNGKLIKPLDGGWYDGRQYFRGKLGKPGVIIIPR